ncbi:DUF4179 domain-containing protein [Clostridium intestinale]|uniref:DUF4179 domain-containing protein n=1 Tax=Clostridium intestinale DSM 6191 TaxID=1121320 RepID=A0A1M5VV93_9CLOT|nr:DUF4179 domain-containing protein [Clostridium intestinale]SHH79219.1 protein of unknown function [Clostridium intestinale DSM 6191]
MKSHLREDDVLGLLNDVKINETELSDLEINDNEINQINNEVLKNIKIKKSRKKKWMIAASIGFISVVLFLGKPAIAAIGSKFFVDDEGVKKAVENNYIQTVDGKVDYDSGVKIELTDAVIDKAKMALGFKVKFDDLDILKKQLNSLWMDVEIKDENGMIISGYMSQGLSDKNVIECISSRADQFKVDNEEAGEGSYELILASNDSKIPDLKRLEINIREIRYFYFGEHNNPHKQIDGNWNFNIDVDKKLRNSKKFVMKALNNREDIKIISSETSPTGTVIKYICTEDKEIDVFNNVVLIDSKGNENNVIGGWNRTYDSEERPIYTVTFPITTFDDLNNLTFKIKEYDGEEIKIKLNK